MLQHFNQFFHEVRDLGHDGAYKLKFDLLSDAVDAFTCFFHGLQLELQFLDVFKPLLEKDA